MPTRLNISKNVNRCWKSGLVLLSINFKILGAMKYRKLILILLLVVSFVGLSVYRTEYLKLRQTFELGGILPAPLTIGNCSVLNPTLINTFDERNLFSWPRNSWSKSGNFYIYSAFVQNERNGVTATALGVAESNIKCPLFKCNIWYTMGGMSISHRGKFSCINSPVINSTGFIYQFQCKLTSNEVLGKSYMLVLIDKQSKKKFFLPTHQIMNNEKVDKAAVCVYPDMSALEKLFIVEFLSYHRFVGFTDILVYDNGFQHEIIYSLTRLFDNIRFLRSFSLLHWDFPLDDNRLAEEFIKMDCLYRTSGSVELTVFLTWTQYIIPVKNKNILTSLKIYNNGEPQIISLNRKICCTDANDDKQVDKSWPVIFRKISCLPQFFNVNIILNPQITGNFKNLSLPLSELYINEYNTCGNLVSETATDNSSLKYVEGVINSSLISFWRSGTLM